MSAPIIPNLTTFRRGTRGGRSGLLNRATQVDRDAIVRSTDGDAASSRMSAVEAGYLDDPFAKYLTDENWQRRLPLMNRGTYVRTTAIDRIVDTFLNSTEGSRQIVSLGAGSDTRYFRLKRENRHVNLSYHEIDLEENNRIKIDRLRDQQCTQTIKNLCDVDLAAARIRESELESSDYSIHSLDLRRLPEELPWLDPSSPTIFISECCLIYLTPDEADQVMTYFSNLFISTPLSIVIYEPFRPHDPFGRTMIRNLTTRGIVLQTIEKYSELDSQVKRLTDRDFMATAADTNSIWQAWISHTEKGRLDNLEWMDEVEEFVLLARHYCIAWGWRNFPDDNFWRTLTLTS